MLTHFILPQHARMRRASRARMEIRSTLMLIVGDGSVCDGVTTPSGPVQVNQSGADAEINEAKGKGKAKSGMQRDIYSRSYIVHIHSDPQP